VVDDRFPDPNELAEKTKQVRREKRRAKDRAKMPQHGKSLARVYKDATSRRAQDVKDRQQAD
jgi:hypothetical protein